MSTLIRPEVSKKNPYWIEKHRYYELKHFCLQYPLWKEAYQSIDEMSVKPYLLTPNKNNIYNDPTVKYVEAKMYYKEKIALIEETAKETDELLSEYILKGVTEGITYEFLKLKTNIPCCRDIYYELYRRFFWLLNKARN